jgi:DNA polymerase-3 subunit delta'
MEEPRPGNTFILSAPQRERLLPTLVSRSWALTLPWPHPDDLRQVREEDWPRLQEWGEALFRFAESGQGWMERTARKGDLDAALAEQLLLLCRQALAQAMSLRASGGRPNPLAPVFRALAPPDWRRLAEMLAECQDSLNLKPSPVNPSLLMDWLATGLFLARAQGGKAPAAPRP